VIAIHHRPGSFSDQWLEYCDLHNVPHKQVNCFASDIIDQMADCDGLLWHWAHHDYRAVLFARQLIHSVERMGKQVFPNSRTCWHYDDKVGQKYLLEAVGAPLIPSYVFYSAGDALKWVETADFPKVFKLRGGAGSVNVSLVESRRQARALIGKAFGRGFSPVNRWSILKDKAALLRRSRTLAALKNCVKAAGCCVVPGRLERHVARQKDYVYFQDFLPGNAYDTRLVVIGNRCFGVRRYCRKGDFRASGSGLLEYDPALFDKTLLDTAFQTAERLGSQSLAFDFLYDVHRRPQIGEVSYAFPSGPFLEDCPGYWDRELTWIAGRTKPTHCMIEDFIAALNARDAHA